MKQEDLKKIIEYAVSRGWDFDKFLEDDWYISKNWDKGMDKKQKEIVINQL